MPSGCRYWSAGCVPSVVIPYRNPSPTAVAGPLVDARFTVRDSLVAAAPWVGAASMSAEVSSVAAAAATWLRLVRIIQNLLGGSHRRFGATLPGGSRSTRRRRADG